jgi:hypothetical protein
MHTLDDLERGALTGATQVRLTHLGLGEFPRQLFELADTLELLDLSGNALSALPDDLHRFTRLRVLFASDNPFTRLSPVLGQCPALEMIGFKACAISEVPADSLPPALRWLILTGNQIRNLPAALGQRPRLQKLMLSCNELDELPDLSGCTRLELVRLAGNRFAAIPPSLFALPALCWLALAGNPLTAAAETHALQDAAASAWPMDALEPGELLGEGASGRIHRARHRDSGQSIALKLFKAAQTSDGTPASELAAGLRAGSHPQLLTPLGRVDGSSDGALATVLPLLPASFVALAGPPDLDSCTRDVYPAGFRVSPAQAERLLAQVHAAISHLHAQGVIHGDLYAHNLLWDPHGGNVVLSDFGAATLTEGLPPAQVEHLQAMEWRAFAHLRAELYARTVQGTSAATP